MNLDDIIDYRVLSRRTVRARKDYVCSACNRPILKGFAYCRIAAIEDGKFVFDRVHPGLMECVEDEGRP